MLFVLSGATLVAQTPARDRTSPLPVTGTAAIRGRVVVWATNDAVRHAVLTISGGGTRIPAILSDEEGRFQFSALPSATFTITAAKPGFAKTSVTVEVAAGRTVEAPPITLQRGAVLTGTLVDESGQPLLNDGVLLLRVNTNSDGTAAQIAAGSADTDDLGNFRFGSLAAGTYTVTAMRVRNGIVMSVPSGTDFGQMRLRLRIPESTLYTVQAGEERSGLVVVGSQEQLLNSPRPMQPPSEPQLASMVRGRVTRGGGMPAARAGVQLMAVTPGLPLVTQTDEQGRYEFVVPNNLLGDYRVFVRKPGYAFAEYGASSPSRRGTVLPLKAGDVREDVDVTLTRLSSASGRILDDLATRLKAHWCVSPSCATWTASASSSTVPACRRAPMTSDDIASPVCGRDSTP